MALISAIGHLQRMVRGESMGQLEDMRFLGGCRDLSDVSKGVSRMVAGSTEREREAPHPNSL